MPSDRSVCDDITTWLTPPEPVMGRAMFGGFGIFMDGVMFGLIADSDLYLEVDAKTDLLLNLQDRIRSHMKENPNPVRCRVGK